MRLSAAQRQRPRAEVFEWPVPRQLPVITVPLANGDPDATLDRVAVNAVYDEFGYAFSLVYDEPLNLPIRPADEAWVQDYARRGVERQKRK